MADIDSSRDAMITGRRRVATVRVAAITTRVGIGSRTALRARFRDSESRSDSKRREPSPRSAAIRSAAPKRRLRAARICMESHGAANAKQREKTQSRIAVLGLLLSESRRNCRSRAEIRRDELSSDNAFAVNAAVNLSRPTFASRAFHLRRALPETIARPNFIWRRSAAALSELKTA